MLDYWKLWIHDTGQMMAILNDKRIFYDYTHNEAGALISIKGKYKGWEIKTLSPVCMEIAGSIHKDWNGGTNENDFHISEILIATDNFCKDLNLEPNLAFVKNLEFGVNLQLPINASEIIDQILCFNNLQPLRPYDTNPNYYFIEFAQGEYYLKVYDKGKQYQKELPHTPNTLRIEVKAIKNRFLPNVRTLADLQRIETLQLLGVKFAKIVRGIVFDDDTLNSNDLNPKDRKLYRELSNPRKWKHFRGNTSSSTRNKVERFKHLIETKGSRKVYSLIFESISTKLNYLINKGKLMGFTPNTYTVKPDNKRLCPSCGRDISQQHPKSLFCSAKYVGEKEAKKCRNKDSNKRNNLANKIKKINSKGVLFSIESYIIERQNVRK